MPVTIHNCAVVPYANQLLAIAPDINELVKSLVDEANGNAVLSDIVKSIHDLLKEEIPQITERDVRDLISGAYNQKQKTRNQLSKELHDLKEELKLINKLADLESGKEPVSERGKQNRNKNITDLRDAIKKFRRDNPTDKDKLDAVKKSYDQRIKNVEEDLTTGKFLNPAPPKPAVKLDAEALAAKDKLIKLKNERKLRLLKDQYANRSVGEKALTTATDILNIPRALMTTLDFSAVLRQGLIPSISHPGMALDAGKQMFKSAWTQEEYDRWFFDLENSSRFNLMKESGLALTDNTNPALSVREENFMSNLAERIPLVGQTLNIPSFKIKGVEIGNTKIHGANLIKKSERAYGAYINKMRADLFNRFADAMESRGLDFENSPKQYKAMADYINNATGRGDLGTTLNKVSPLLNALFFSPRLIASRLNMLTYFAQPRFYKTVPTEVRKAYFADMAKFIAVGTTVLSLAALACSSYKPEDENDKCGIELDPRSSDFGKIRWGNTRWDIWGGFQPYIRVATQIFTGERKSTNTGDIIDLSGDEAVGDTRSDVALGFIRGKLAPVQGISVDLFSKRTASGQKIIWGETSKDNTISIGQYIKDHLLPLSLTGTQEAIKDQGIKALFTVGVPSIFGIGTQTYEVKRKGEKYVRK